MLPLDFNRAIELCDSATKGEWIVRTANTPWGTDISFVQAPEDIIHNPRGFDYAKEILADDDYDTKAADQAFIAYFNPQRVRDMVTEIANQRAQCP